MKKWLPIFLAVSLILLLAVFVCSRIFKPTRQTVKGILAPMNTEELSRKAGTVLIGTVKEKLDSKEDNNQSRLSTVYTDVIVSAEKFLKNPQIRKELKVRLAGGKTDEKWVWVEDEATLEPGERVLLFLDKSSDGGEIWTVTGLAQGKFKIVGRKAKNQMSESEIDLDSLIEDIKKAIK